MAEDETTEEEKASRLAESSKNAGDAIRKFNAKVDPGGPNVSTAFHGVEGATKSQVRKDNKANVDSLMSVHNNPPTSTPSATDASGKPIRTFRVENIPPALPANPLAMKFPDMPKTGLGTNKTLSLPGAGNGVFLLGGTLAIVAVWGSVIHPLIDLSWNGKYKTTKGMTMPPSGIISLVLFILLITFVSTLSPDFANVAFLFVLALWAVYLIMNPTVVQNVASFVSQGNTPKSTDSSSSDGTTGAGTHPTSH